MPLVQFSPLAEDIWTLEDAFQGTVIFGSTGSGKTSGSGQLLALKFLKAGFGGLVLCVDIEEANVALVSESGWPIERRALFLN